MWCVMISNVRVAVADPGGVLGGWNPPIFKMTGSAPEWSTQLKVPTYRVLKYPPFFVSPLSNVLLKV